MSRPPGAALVCPRRVRMGCVVVPTFLLTGSLVVLLALLCKVALVLGIRLRIATCFEIAKNCKGESLSSRMSILLAAIAYVSCWLRLPVELVLYDVAS